MGDYESSVDSVASVVESDSSSCYSLVPHVYRLSLFNIHFQDPWAYSGHVTIAATASQLCNCITLNAKELEIQSASVELAAGKEIGLESIDYSAIEETACLQFSSAIPDGDVSIKIQFRGTINQSMSGFFRTQYLSNAGQAPANSVQGEESMLVTHFEPCNARRAFPCFDDPALKATFELTIEVPNHLCVLSNMPAASETISEGPIGKLRKHTFGKTPKMSTYLLVWAVGEFEYIEAFTHRRHCEKHVPVRIYTTPGLSQYGRFALGYACKVLDFFAEMFDIDYPLPKSDHLIANDFIGGAMENWGLIVYKPTKILFEAGSCDNRLQNKAAYVVAHELAHQWFGNLVTMKDWSQLWLNEGFATWAAYLAMDHILPDWKPWIQFNVEVMEEAFILDGLTATHPIETEVDDSLAAHQAFDNISYFKGASVIRMLCSYIGPDVFCTGVSTYLKEHAYGNATSKDLWKALSQVSALDVAELMSNWIHAPGYPIVEASNDGRACSVSQRPYSWSEPGSTTWNIPLIPRKQSLTGHSVLQNSIITFPSIAQRGINEGHTGFYRTSYDPAYVQILDPQTLAAVDKAGNVADLLALCLIDQKPIGEFLALAQSLKQEVDTFVWQQISASFGTLRSIFASETGISDGIKSFLEDLMTSILGRVDWNVTGAGYLEVELKKIILSLAESIDHQTTIAEAQRLFSEWRAGGHLDGNFQLLVFSCGVGRGTKAEFDTIKQRYLRTTSIDGKEICLRAMARVTEPDLIRDLVKFATSHHVPLQNANIVAGALARNPQSRRVLWNLMKEDWHAMHKKLSQNETALALWIEDALSQFSDLDIMEDIKAFFADKDCRVFARSLAIAYAKIERNARFKASSAKQLSEWLPNSGDAQSVQIASGPKNHASN